MVDRVLVVFILSFYSHTSFYLFTNDSVCNQVVQMKCVILRSVLVANLCP